MNLEVQNLGYRYDDKKVFENVNFQFKPDELTLIRGPSGCGKSTFLKLIANLIPKQTGEILISGTNPGTAAKIGFVHQECHLVDHWSIEENLLMVNSERNKFSGLLNNFDLTMSTNKLVQLLSGGERQRLSLIRVLLQSPDIVLLDEPTAHLDDEHAASALKIIKNQFKTKMILVVSHDQRVIPFADQIFDWKKAVGP